MCLISDFSFKKNRYTLIFCPLMDLANIFEATLTPEYNDTDCFYFATKVAIVLFCCFDFLKEVR